MDLTEYDGKCVRLTCTDGEVYEGLAAHNSADYDYHEYGTDEEGLTISYFLFYKSQIVDIKIIDEFSNPYGRIEELTIEDGFDLVEQTLTSEDDIACGRLLECLKKYLDPDCEEKIRYESQVLELLKTEREHIINGNNAALIDEILKRR